MKNLTLGALFVLLSPSVAFGFAPTDKRFLGTIENKDIPCSFEIDIFVHALAVFEFGEQEFEFSLGNGQLQTDERTDLDNNVYIKNGWNKIVLKRYIGTSDAHEIDFQRPFRKTKTCIVERVEDL